MVQILLLGQRSRGHQAHWPTLDSPVKAHHPAAPVLGLLSTVMVGARLWLICGAPGQSLAEGSLPRITRQKGKRVNILYPALTHLWSL